MIRKIFSTLANAISILSGITLGFALLSLIVSFGCSLVSVSYELFAYAITGKHISLFSADLANRIGFYASGCFVIIVPLLILTGFFSWLAEIIIDKENTLE